APELERKSSQESSSSSEKGDVITPWDVSAEAATGVDYNKLIVRFGVKKITDDLVDRLERLTGKRAHPMLRRGMFFAHRDFSQILDRYEKGEPFFLYTGRGPSSRSLHLGHLLPFFFTKYLQEALDVPLIIQMTDDEKFIWRSDLTVGESKKMTKENMKDIISVGFDPEKTFIFQDFEYMCPPFYENIVRIWKYVTGNQARSIFGFIGEDSMGKAAFPAIEAAPCFASSFPHIFKGRKDIGCLIPCGIDQDPYFRMCRDVAPRLNSPKPSLIYSKFLPALQGSQCKMAASDANSCIYLSDTPKEIKNKINKYAFSGGRPTVEEHREKGGDCEIDISYQFLTYFMEDDQRLEEIRLAYSSGQMLTGELKKIAIEEVTRVINEMQSRRVSITDEVVDLFTSVRPLKYTF
ncbi:hypothetical protein PFISCL1PPCAC_1877, partial [Pristionchus fissidentatus]